MPTERYGKTETITGDAYGDGQDGLGSANHAKLKNSFSASPVYAGDIPLWTDYLDNVLRGNSDIVSETLDMTVRSADGESTLTPSRTFEENSPPSITNGSITVGASGLPGSPWTPNLASPGEDNGVDYTALPSDNITVTADDANNNPGIGLGGTYSPDAAALNQSTSSPTDGTNNSSYELGVYSPLSIPEPPPSDGA